MMAVQRMDTSNPVESLNELALVMVRIASNQFAIAHNLFALNNILLTFCASNSDFRDFKGKVYHRIFRLNIFECKILKNFCFL